MQVRVPLADSTVMKAGEDIADNALVLMADIFPTLVSIVARHRALTDESQGIFRGP